MDISVEQLAELPQWQQYLLWATVALAALWVVLTIFVQLRRKASNLTPVNAPSANKKAAPDFLKVDHKAREAQIKRGETFERELDAREAAEARTLKKVTLWSRLAGLATLLFSIFSLLATISTVYLQVDRIGSTFSQSDRLLETFQKYPIPFAVCAFVIGYYVVTFFAQKQWKQGQR
jgi:hypothetical protein